MSTQKFYGNVDFTHNAGGAGKTSQLLDDYEEGIWTIGVSFGGGTTGITYLAGHTTGLYTRVGRLVTISGRCILTSKGTSSGDAAITGLPFTVYNDVSAYASVSVLLSTVTFANQFNAFASPNTTNIVLGEMTEAGVNTSLTDADFDNASRIIVGGSYFTNF